MIPDIIPVNTFTGNNSAVHFEYDFLITKASELLVLHTDNKGMQVPLKLNIDYLLYDIGNPDGGYIVFPILGSSYNKLAKDETITLMLNLPIMQSTPYGTSSKLDLKTLEYSLDYIVRCLQMLNRKQERSVKVQEGSSESADDLINALTNAQVNAKNYANEALSSANDAKQSAESAVSAKNEFVETAECSTENLIKLGNDKNELLLNTADNKINEINNTIKNIEGSVISGRFIGELIPAVIPILMADGSLSQTVRFTNGDWISQNGIFKKGINHIKMVASLYPHITCTAEEYDEMITKYGECPKFVFNDDTGMMRLPKIKSIIQGITSLTDLAKVIEAGLPNHSHTFTRPRGDRNYGNGGGNVWWGGDNVTVTTSAASTSNALYGKSNTVQPQTVTGAYYIVLATGVDQNVKTIQNIEVVNHEFDLLQPIFSDKLINNPCWLRSYGQWNNSEDYPTVWNYLLQQYNMGIPKQFSISVVVDKAYQNLSVDYIETPDLLKIVDISNVSEVDNLYNANGSAWFYVIDRQNYIFRLPQSENYIKFTSDITCVGCDVAEELPNIYGTMGARSLTNQDNMWANGAFFNNGRDGNQIAQHVASNTSISLGLNASLYDKRYKEGGKVQTAATQFFLYFKVGNTIQNAQIINVGRIAENRLSVNADNLSNTGRSVIKAYTMPDYDNSIEYPIETLNIAPADGYLYFYAFIKSASQSTNQNIERLAYGAIGNSEENMKNVFIAGNFTSNTDANYSITTGNINSHYIRIAQGEYFKMWRGEQYDIHASVTCTLKFIPMKG